MLYALAASFCTALAYLLIKYFCWNYRLQALTGVLISVYVLLLGMRNLPDNSSLTKVLLG